MERPLRKKDLNEIKTPCSGWAAWRERAGPQSVQGVLESEKNRSPKRGTPESPSTNIQIEIDDRVVAASSSPLHNSSWPSIFVFGSIVLAVSRHHNDLERSAIQAVTSPRERCGRILLLSPPANPAAQPSQVDLPLSPHERSWSRKCAQPLTPSFADFEAPRKRPSPPTSSGPSYLSTRDFRNCSPTDWRFHPASRFPLPLFHPPSFPPPPPLPPSPPSCPPPPRPPVPAFPFPPFPRPPPSSPPLPPPLFLPSPFFPPSLELIHPSVAKNPRAHRRSTHAPTPPKTPHTQPRSKAQYHSATLTPHLEPQVVLFATFPTGKKPAGSRTEGTSVRKNLEECAPDEKINQFCSAIIPLSTILYFPFCIAYCSSMNVP